MHSAQTAIAWQLWWPYRWWIVAGSVYWLALATAAHLMPAGNRFDVITWQLALPVGGGALALLAMFCYGSGMDLAARESGFPKRMFVLPLSNRALVRGPMLFGAVAAGLLWLATATWIVRPRAVEVPLWWPAAFAAGFSAWFQALCWRPFPLALLRLPVAVAVLGLYVALAVLGAWYDVPEPVMVGGFAVQLPLAWAVALRGVRRARCGDTPNWQWLATTMPRAAWPTLARRPFRSAAAAQAWYEWRLNGWALPVAVCLLLPLLMATTVASHLGLLSPQRSSLGPLSLLFQLPPLLALSTGFSLGRLGGGKRPYTCPSFLATRPLDNVAPLAAKFRVAAKSSAIACVLTFVAAGLLAVLTGECDTPLRWWNGLRQNHSPIESASMVALVPIVMFAVTWAVMVQGLWVGLSGRTWVLVISIAVLMAVFFGSIFGWCWVQTRPDLHDLLKSLIPQLMAVAAVVKVALAGWLIRLLLGQRLVKWPTIVRAGGVWLAAAAGLVAAVWWLAPADLVRWHTAAAGVVLVMPSLGIALAPLTLAWNRHR